MTNLDTLVATDTPVVTDPVSGPAPAPRSDGEQGRRVATDFQRQVLRALQNDVARCWLGAVRSGQRQDSARFAEASHALQRAARLLEEPATEFERT